MACVVIASLDVLVLCTSSDQVQNTENCQNAYLSARVVEYDNEKFGEAFLDGVFLKQ